MSLAPATLLVGLAVSAPSLWSALVEQDMPIEVALQRLVIILLVVGVGGSALHALLDAYTKTAPSSAQGAGGDTDRRRATNGSDSPQPPAA